MQKPYLVSVCGHINHGKSTLIEKLSGAKIVKGEVDKITQDVFAYNTCEKYDLPNLILLDTPGHADFNLIKNEMIKISDFVILVIDTTDGIKTETKECIGIIRKFNIPAIVYFSKKDIAKGREKIKEEDLISTDLDFNVYDILVAYGGLDSVNSILENIKEMMSLTIPKSSDLTILNTVKRKNEIIWQGICYEIMEGEYFIHEEEDSAIIKIKKCLPSAGLIKQFKVEKSSTLKLGRYKRTTRELVKAVPRVLQRNIVKIGIKASTVGELLTLVDIVNKWKFSDYKAVVTWSDLGDITSLDKAHFKIGDFNIAFNVNVPKGVDILMIKSINEVEEIYKKIKNTIICKLGKIIKIFSIEGNKAIIGIDVVESFKIGDLLTYNDEYIKLLSIESDNKNISIAKSNTKVAICITSNKEIKYAVNNFIYRDNKKVK